MSSKRKSAPTTNRWQSVRELFHSCLDRPASKRQEFLEEAADGDRELIEEVLSLLSHHDDPGTLVDRPETLDTPPQPKTQAAPESPSPEGSGPDGHASGGLERYELLETLGRGGMGVVYRARRADGAYDDQVAVKLMHQDFAAEDLVQRFWQERQILADLKHPAIARLLDGGSAGHGRPFLVMEYVDGTPIDEYCDGLRLGFAPRIDLFIEVCRAVHFAHQNLVVHRDLKPANLLVSAVGEPKLLDFGIAKLIDPAAPDETLFADAESGSPMTPDFASPEQVRRGTITTASDVYALGVILYLLLTGQRPIQSGRMSLSEFVEAVAHQEPAAPSRRVLADESASAEVAAARGFGDRQALGRALTGDLDRIVLMALQKEPSARYASAEAMAEDLERYRNGLPVLARDQTLSYRVGKFLKRNRWPSLLAAAAIFGFLALTTGLLIQRNELLEEKALSGEVTSFLEGLFEVSTPESSQGEPILARELLDEGARDVRWSFQDQPRVKARLLSTMGRAYLSLGHLEDAEALLDESLQAQLDLNLGGAMLADTVMDMGDLRRAQGDYEDSQRLFEQAEASGDEDDPARKVRRLLGSAQALELQSQFEQALELQRQALDLAARSFGTSHERYAQALLAKAETLRVMGEYEPAEKALADSRAIIEEVHGAAHPEVSHLSLQLALWLQEQGRYVEAESELRRGLALQIELYEPDHPRIADTVTNLAFVLLQLENLQEAEERCLEGLEIRREALGQSHPEVGGSLNLLGLIQRRQERPEEAEASFRQARSMWRDAFGPEHVQLAAVSNNLAQILRDRGELKVAEAEYREALRIYRAAFGEEHLQIATVLNNLGFLRKKQGDLEGARRLYEAALEMLGSLLGPEHPQTALNSHNLGVLLGEMGLHQDSEKRLRAALESLQKALPTGHPNLAIVRKNLAGSLNALGRLDEAEALLEEALEAFEAAGQEEDRPNMLRTRGLLAEVLMAGGRWDEAEEILQDVLEIARASHGEESELFTKNERRLEELHQRRRASAAAP